MNNLPISEPVSQVDNHPIQQPPLTDVITINESIENFNDNDFKAISNALEMFKRK